MTWVSLATVSPEKAKAKRLRAGTSLHLVRPAIYGRRLIYQRFAGNVDCVTNRIVL